ncbi:hypothetical protein D3C77_612560 [compost metagenome]
MLATWVPTSARPPSVSRFAPWALSAAAAALRATSWAVADISFIAVATCSMRLRCSVTAWLLCAEIASTRRAWLSTSPTVCPTRSISMRICATLALNTWLSSASSSRLSTRHSTVRSPAATCSMVRPRAFRVVRIET